MIAVLYNSPMKDTSWNKVGKWYSKITKDGGHYYHTHVVMPKTLELLQLKPDSRLLDLACGTGVLAESAPVVEKYLGIDLAASLIKEAKDKKLPAHYQWQVADVTKPLQLEGQFTHAAIILALQNMQYPEGAINNAARLLEPGGKLVIVINHPAFRIPRQSSWGVDEGNKLRFRRINRYLSPLEIPITAHPGQKASPVTWSYHLPLSSYFEMLTRQGMVIDSLEEWTSDKQSQGKARRQENLAREEFPLFLAIRARHLHQTF